MDGTDMKKSAYLCVRETQKGISMNFDFGQLSQMGGKIDQVLSSLPYPLDKDEVCACAKQAGANDQVIGAMQRILPDKTFNSPEDIKKCLGGGMTKM